MPSSLAAVPTWVYKLLIVFATAIWGLSFVIMKDVVECLPPAWLLGIRFFTAGLILLAVLWKRVRKHLSLKSLRTVRFWPSSTSRPSFRRPWDCCTPRRASTPS